MPDDRRGPTTTGRHRALVVDEPASQVRSNLSDRVAYLQGALAVADVRLVELEKDMTELQVTLKKLAEQNAQQSGALAFGRWLLGFVGLANIVALILWALKGQGHGP